jgi:transmembrane sensor
MNEDVTLAKWLNDEMDDRELKDFMSKPEYATYSKIKEFSGRLTVPETDMAALYKNISDNKYRTGQRSVRKLNPWIARVAAILVLALGATFFLYATYTTTQRAAIAGRETFLLPDSSEVVLNAGSEANYREFNWSGNRKLELEGEAYFKVAKGQKFDVVTPFGTVTVVGTQFNVKARNGRLDVVCYEGKVKVTNGTDIVLLTPGKTVAYLDGKNLNVPNAKGTKPGWLNYETYFSKVQLRDVISEMERQYNITISLKNIPQPNSPFNGTVPMNNLDMALDALLPVYHLQAKNVGDTIILSAE